MGRERAIQLGGGGATAPCKIRLQRVGPDRFFDEFSDDLATPDMRESYSLGKTLRRPAAKDGPAQFFLVRAPFAEASAPVIGGVERHRHEIGFFLRPDFRGLGLASHLLSALIDSAAHGTRLTARTLRSNTAARRALLAAGFHEIGLIWSRNKGGHPVATVGFEYVTDD